MRPRRQTTISRAILAFVVFINQERAAGLNRRLKV
jgi:hypothetical protein